MKKLITIFLIVILLSCNDEMHILERVLVTKQELKPIRFKEHHKGIYMYTILEDEHGGEIFIFSDSIYKVGDTLIFKNLN